MTSVKKFNANVVIQTPVATGIASNITLDSDFVFVTGNLTVIGNTTTVTSNNLTISDNVIVLNRGESGAGVTKGNAGILIDRGTQIAAQLQWAESYKTWQVSGNSAVFANILVSSTGNVGLTRVQDDPAPALGGNLVVGAYALISNTNIVVSGNTLVFQANTNSVFGNIQVNYLGANTVVTAGSNSTVMYGKTTFSGGSGLWVINPTISAADELITVNKALAFGLLFG
jgi:hypothetical protein